jgi:hypothetical protein
MHPSPRAPGALQLVGFVVSGFKPTPLSALHFPQRQLCRWLGTTRRQTTRLDGRCRCRCCGTSLWYCCRRLSDRIV